MMTNDELTVKTYLETVFDKCNRDTQQQVSMYEAGEAIGLEKNEAGSLAEDLMVEGLLELKSLAGNVSLTVEGLAMLGISSQDSLHHTDEFRLSRETIVNEADLTLIQQLIDDTKKVTGTQPLEFALLEEIVFDLKTLEVQLLSPQPKTAIIREILGSIQNTLTEAQLTETAEKIACSLG